MFNIYSDISVRYDEKRNPAYTSYCYYIESKGTITKRTGLFDSPMHSTVAEIKAVNLALQEIPDKSQVNVFTDVDNLYGLVIGRCPIFNSGILNEIKSLRDHQNRLDCRLSYVVKSKRSYLYKRCHKDSKSLCEKAQKRCLPTGEFIPDIRNEMGF